MSSLKVTLVDKDDEIETLKKKLIEYSLQLDVDNLVRNESQNRESSDLPKSGVAPSQSSSRELGLNPNLTPYTHQLSSTIEVFPENLDIVKKEEM